MFGSGTSRSSSGGHLQFRIENRLLFLLLLLISSDPAGTVTLSLVTVLLLTALTALIEIDSSDVCNNLELLAVMVGGDDVVVVT
jgi:hypothetical protein